MSQVSIMDDGNSLQDYCIEANLILVLMLKARLWEYRTQMKSAK
jgi:hypothetical protein